MLDPFEVIRNKRVSVKLQLLQSIKIYNAFHANLLKKTFTDSLTNQVNELSFLVIINNKKKWEVENILNAKSYQGKLQYQIKWVGWDKNKKWYNMTRFDNSLEIIKDFYSCYTDESRSGKPVAYRSERKKSWKLRNFFYYLLKKLRILIRG